MKNIKMKLMIETLCDKKYNEYKIDDKNGGLL